MSNLVIGVDLRGTEAGFKAHFGRGTGRYAQELWAALQGVETPDVRVVPLRSSDIGLSRIERGLVKALPFGQRTLEDQLLVPARIARMSLDGVHYMAHCDAPSLCGPPAVVTILDLIPLRLGDLYRAKRSNWRFKFARNLEIRAAKRARGIIAISEATKRDVVELLGIGPERIEVVPLAAGNEFTYHVPASVEERKANLEAFGLPTDRPMILYVGGIDARKNVEFLVNAVERLNAETPLRPLLVLAGAYERDENFPEFKQRLDTKNAERYVKLLGFVEDSQLAKLYRAASCFAFPSLYEGFGLPVLEALSCGVPVVCGNNSSLPEVAGKAAYLVSDYDIDHWVAILKEVICNQDKAGQMGADGLERAKRFSWDLTARQTITAYLRFLEA